MRALRWAWDRLTLYLPVFLMGLLAMATYWLVRSSPEPASPSGPAPPGHLPDYFMHRFSVQTFDREGQLKSVVAGDEARHYPDTDRLEIDRVSIRSFDAQGQLTTATAQRALTTGDGAQLTLIGQARVLRAAWVDAAGQPHPEMRFEGERLDVDVNAQRVRSDQPVTLIRGDSRFTADRMDYDNPQRRIVLLGRVRGVVAPRPGPLPEPRPAPPARP